MCVADNAENKLSQHFQITLDVKQSLLLQHKYLKEQNHFQYRIYQQIISSILCKFNNLIEYN